MKLLIIFDLDKYPCLLAYASTLARAVSSILIEISLDFGMISDNFCFFLTLIDGMFTINL